MKGLCEDICRFLQDQGFDCTLRNECGMRVIYVSAHGDETMVILPVEASAATIEHAADQARSLGKRLMEYTGDICNEMKARPIIITEDRWKSNNEMMRARLLAHLKDFTQIYARNCEVRKIDKKTAAGFLEAFHSYGDASCRHRYGLFLRRHTGHNAEDRRYIGELIAVATFSNGRRWIKGDKTIRSYEWTRYASLPQMRISGGMGKLLKAFIADVDPDDIMTYADLEWSDGKVYEQLGFTLEGRKEPVAFVIDTLTWRRVPASKSMSACTDDISSGRTHLRYYINPGSNKYRLKLTDYQ